MYIDEDFYLSRYKQNFKDDKEAYEFLKRCFPELYIMPVKDSYLSSVLCMYSYLSYCFSVTEMAAAFGNFFASASVRTRLAELKNKKSGALTSLSFSNYDMGARKAYNITKSGFQNYLSSIPDAIKPARGQIMVRRSGGLVPIHDYGVGISLISFIQLGIPFSYEKEENYTLKNLFKEHGSVCVDCTLYVAGSRPFKVYVEQDMGNESTLVLVNKLGKYKRLGMTGNDTCIVYSSHAVMDYPSCPSYVVGVLESIYEGMGSSGAGGIFEYYEEKKNELDEKTLLTLMALLVRTGVCVAYADEYALRKDRRLSAEQVSTTSIIRRRMNVTYYMKVEERAVPSEDFSPSELRRYIDELSSGTNPYRLIAYNRQQSQIAKQKYRNMCTMLCHYINKGYYDRDEVMSMLSGYSAYMVASVLLSNSACHFLPKTAAYLNKLRAALLPYYPGIDKAEYSEYSQLYSFEGYAPVIFRNTFQLADGRIVAVEHIGKDIGGFVRCYYLRQLSSIMPNLNLHMVCLCDNDSDMIHFCEYARYSVKYSRFEGNSNFYLSFLMEEDLEDDCCLLKNINDLENPTPIYIRTMEQSASLKQHRQNNVQENKVPDLAGMTLAELFGGSSSV